MDALDWIALSTSHIPDGHEQTVRYCGRFSNAARGKRRKQALGQPPTDAVDSVSEPDSTTRRFARDRRRNWAVPAGGVARLLKKIYQVGPLTCTHCGNKMEIITLCGAPHKSPSSRRLT